MKPPIPLPPRPLAKHVVAMLQPKTAPLPIQTRAAALAVSPPCALKPSIIQQALPVQIRAKAIRPLTAPSPKRVIQRFPVAVPNKGKTIHVLSHSDSCNNPYNTMAKVDVRVVQNEPIRPSDLTAVNQLVAQINNLLTGNSEIVVHCQAGQHRSHVVVIYYLFRHCGMTLQEAFNLVEEKRNVHKHTLDSLDNLVFGGPSSRRGPKHNWNHKYDQLPGGVSSQSITNNTATATNETQSKPPSNNSYSGIYMKISEREVEEVVREGNNFVKHQVYNPKPI